MPNNINFSIGFTVDKTGLNDLQQQLDAIQQLTIRDMQALNEGLSLDQASEQLNAVKQTAMDVQVALQQAFNADLGTINVTKFNQELQKINLNKIYNEFSSIGTVGQNAFRSITAQLLSTNTQLQRSHTLLDSMADTMSRTIKWGVASSMMNRLAGSVQEAYGYVKSLDSSLNDIRIVTQKSAEDMSEFAVQANNAAMALGASTTDYTNASLLYYQQGLSDEDVQARTDVTLKAANVTGQAAAEVSEELTAVWNGYQVTSEEAEASIDVLAAVAANTASNLEELSTGMSKVASSANAMGVSEEQLAAQLSTIISATRQAPETTGQALRTIYARMSTINAGGVDDEDGATLTSYSAKMDKFGISVLDANGQLRDMGEVIEEIGGKWADFTREQQISLAQAMAGTRQYNNLLALFENWDQYTRALDIANNSLGTLQEQQDIYMESTEAHLQQLDTAWEDLFDSLFSGSDINVIADVMTTLVEGVASFVDAIGGGIPLLTSLGSIGLSVFSTQIGRGLSTMINNLRISNQQLDEQNQKMLLAQQYEMEFRGNGTDTGLEKMYQQAKELYGINISLTDTEKEQFNTILKQEAELENMKADWNDQVSAAERYLSNLTDAQDVNVVFSEEGVGHFENLDVNGVEGYIDSINETLGVATENAQHLHDILSTKPQVDFLTDTQKAEEEVNNLVEQLQSIYTVGESTAIVPETYQSDLTKYVNTLKDVGSTEDQVKEAEAKLREAVKDSSDEFKNGTEALIKHSAEYRQCKQAEDDLKNTEIQAREQADKLLNTLDKNSFAYRELESAVKQLNEAEKAGENTDQQWNKLAEALKKAGQAADEMGKQSQQILNNDLNGYATNLTGRLTALSASFENLKKAVTNEAMYKSFSDLIGSLGRFASGIMMIQNLGDIINDDSLSTTEKATQLLMNLGMAVSMIVTALPALNKAWKEFSATLNSTGNAIKGVLSALSNWQIALIALAVVAIAGVVAAIYNFTKSAKNASQELENLNKQVDILSSTFEECTKKVEEFKNAINDYDDAAAAIKELDKNTDEFAEALENANQKAKELIETYGLFSHFSYDENGLIVFDDKALDEMQKQMQSQANQTQEGLYSAKIAQNNAQTTANFEQSRLGQTFVRQANPDEVRTFTIEDIDEIYNWLNEIDAHGVSNAELITMALAENNKELSNAIESYNYDDSSITELLGKLTSVVDKDGNLINNFVADNIITIISLMDTIQEWGVILQNAADANDYYAEQILEGTVREKYGSRAEEIATNENETNAVLESQIITFLATSANQLEVQAENSLAEKISEIDVSNANRSDLKLGNDRDVAETYAREVMHVDEATLRTWNYQGGRGKGSFTDQENNIVMEPLSDDFMVQEIARWREANKLIEERTNELTDQSIETIAHLTEWTREISDEYGEDILSALMTSLINGEAIDFSSLFEKLGPANAESLAASISESNLNDFFDFQELDSLFEDQARAVGKTSGQFLKEAFQEELKEYDFTDWYNRITDTAISAKDTLDTLMADIQSGTVDYQNIEEYDGYAELISQLNTIKEVYPEIAVSCDILSRSWEVGTQKYLEALEQVQDTLFNIKFDKLTQEANNAIDEVEKYFTKNHDSSININIDADPEAFYNAMDDVLNAEYAIDIELHTEAENEFNSVISAMEDIYDKANLIDDSFVVAASDIRELNNTFPGIINGMEDLGNGTVRLNEQIVQSAMNAAEMEAAADAESAVERLETTATLLRAKQKTYEQIAEAAGILATSEVEDDEDSTEARAQLSAGLEQLKELNSQESATSQMNNAEEVADNANDNAEITAQNWNSGFQSAAQSSAEFARTAIDNMMAVASGGGAVSEGNFAVNYSGASGKSKEASIIDDLQSAVDNANTTSKDTYAKLQAEATAIAATTAAAANDVEGMIAEIGATGSKLDDALSGIRNGGSGSGGSGGSGGGGSGSEPKQEDHIEDQADRYHDVNVRLQEISTSLSRLQGQENKLLGTRLIDNLNDQLALLNDQIDTTTQKISIAEGEAQEYYDKLAGQGVVFDANGDIANYAEVMQAQLDYVNSVIDAYNAMTAEQQEEFQDTLDAAKDAYDQFVSDIGAYEDLIHDFIPSLEDDMQDALDQKIQINIQKFTAEVEIRLDMREAEQDWNEFYRKVVLGISDDDIFGGAVENLANVLSYFDTTASDVFKRSGNEMEDWTDAIQRAISMPSGTGTLETLTRQVYDTIDQIEQIEDSGWADIYGDNEAQALEDLKTYYSELMNQLEDIYDLVEEIEDSYLDMIDEAIDRFDEQVSQYEYINDLLNHDINLIGLLYGDDAYEQMARYYEQIEANNNQELDFLRKRADYAYQMMQAETDDEARKKWEEEWEQTLSDLNDKVEDSVQNIIDKYTNTINQIISELNDAVTNGLGLDYVSEEWDLMNQEADIYLDKINEMYAIQDIRNKYLEAIDATDSLTAQQKLNEAMEMELSYLEAKDNLTQADVDRAELLYQITLKQIELEEAQQNKSTMRLRRDSQGNYTYQYVSDQDEVSQLQQELADLQNQLYNFDKQAYIENLDELYSVYEEFQEKILALYEDQTLSAEEREQQIALYVEYYGNIINDLVTENEYLRMNLTQSAIEELAALYDIDVENFRNMTEEEIDELMTNLVPQWDSGVQHMADTFAGEGGFIPTCTDAFDQLNQATLDYQDSLDALEEAAGIDFESIASGYDWTITEAQALLEENDALIDSYAREIDAIQEVISWLHDLMEAYNDVYEAAVRAASAGYDETQYVSGLAGDAYRDDDDYSTSSKKTVSSSTSSTSSTSSSSSGSGSSSGSSGSGSSTQGNGVLEVGDTATYTGGLYYYDSYGTNPTGSRGAGGTVTVTQVKTDGRPYPIHVESTDSAYGWLKQSQLSGYDTGGYTGDWDGDDGALALLHQKELVLNQADTENILTAVGLVRDMSSLLEHLDTSVINKISDLKSSMMNGFSGKFENGNQELEQNVHIDATFPNVRDSQEIEEAFNNLVNIASMHAYRSA